MLAEEVCNGHDPGTLPSQHELGSHQPHMQLATEVRDCNSSYLEAEAGVQGTRGYKVRLPRNNQMTPGFPLSTLLPIPAGLTKEAGVQELFG